MPRSQNGTKDKAKLRNPNGKIVIENFGPIIKAEMELGDFTAIIGPNSSGKTFVINLVDRILNLIVRTFDFTISHNVYQAVKSIIVDEKAMGYPASVKMSAFSEEDAWKVVNETIEKITKKDPPNMKDYKSIEFFRYFQTDPKNLIRFGSTEAKITAILEYARITVVISQRGPPRISVVPDRKVVFNYVKGFEAFYQGDIGGGGYNSSYELRTITTVLVPTERISVLVTMPNIIAELAVAKGIQSLLPLVPQERTSSIKQPLADFLSSYLNALQFSRKSGLSKESAGLIMGDVTWNPDVPAFLDYKEGKHSIPLSLIASGTMQLIPLVILAESHLNSMLIIEEPEINLHANKQVEVADYLWQLIEENNKSAFVSTHSDYFLMRLAQLSKDNKKKSLRVYLLNKGLMTPLTIDENGELEEITTIGAVINRLLLKGR